jgi:hypothetical protein
VAFWNIYIAIADDVAMACGFECGGIEGSPSDVNNARVSKIQQQVSVTA